MISITEWLAPAATMIAAGMTAANLGARVTGWGFVVFTFGSVCWIIFGLASDQTSLVVTNGFLTLVNLIGVWRWLGRQARYEAVATAAEAESPGSAVVLPASGIVGRPVTNSAGDTICEVVETILDCRSGSIEHFVVRFGGVGGFGEQLVALPFADIAIDENQLVTRLSAQALAARPRLDAGTGNQAAAPVAATASRS